MGSGAPKAGLVGVSTVPVTVVLAPPAQAICRRHRFVQALAGLPQTLACPEPPQVSPAVGQAPQSTSPPQPLPITPQYRPVGCWQAVAVQVPGVGAQMLARTAPHISF